MTTNKIISLEEVAKITDTIPGFLLRSEGKLLYDLAKICPEKTKIVEIGSWQGRSTLWLYFGSSSGNNAKILAVDPHTGSPELKIMFGTQSSVGVFTENMKRAGANQLVTTVVMTSEKAAGTIKDSIGMVFIDGDHSYTSVNQDFDLWFSKLITNGSIVLHDTVNYPDVNRLVRTKVFLSSNVKVIKIVDSIVYGQKVNKLALKDKIKNKYILLIHDTCVFLSKRRPPMKLITFGKNIINKIH